MAVRNKIKPVVDAMGKSRYQFWKDIGVAQNTAYGLYNDPEQVPTGAVIDKICNVYNLRVEDILVHVADADLKKAS